MSDCESISKCGFSKNRMDNTMPALAEIMKQNYCQGAWDTCARHKLSHSLGKDSVPVDVFPNQHERANQIIETAALAQRVILTMPQRSWRGLESYARTT